MLDINRKGLLELPAPDPLTFVNNAMVVGYEMKDVMLILIERWGLPGMELFTNNVFHNQSNDPLSPEVEAIIYVRDACRAMVNFYQNKVG